jgi:hypothetical protein
VPESKKDLVRNTYWRGDAEAWLNGTTPVMGGGNGHFPATTRSASRVRR